MTAGSSEFGRVVDALGGGAAAVDLFVDAGVGFDARLLRGSCRLRDVVAAEFIDCFVLRGPTPGGALATVSYVIDEVLREARSGLVRVHADQFLEACRQGALVVDIRPWEQRERDGCLPGALVIDRNVLEWRLDPASPDRIAATAYDRQIVIVCNEGYGSSLAAAMLQRVGLLLATDVVGGFQGLVDSAVVVRRR